MIHTGLPNSVADNLLQVPIVFFALLVPAIVKKKYCDRFVRSNMCWRWDVYRLFVSSIVGFTILCAVAVEFDGDDCVNFFTVFFCYVTLGVILELNTLSLIKKEGYTLGYYRQPPSIAALQRQVCLTTIVTVMATCTSGIFALLWFPYANETFDTHAWSGEGWWYTVVIAPTLYFGIRVCALDSKPNPARSYTPAKMQSFETSPESAFTIGVLSDDEPELQQNDCSPEPSARHERVNAEIETRQDIMRDRHGSSKSMREVPPALATSDR